MKTHSMCVFLLCAVQGLYKNSTVLLDLITVKGYDAENGVTELYGCAQNPCRALRIKVKWTPSPLASMSLPLTAVSDPGEKHSYVTAE